MENHDTPELSASEKRSEELPIATPSILVDPFHKAEPRSQFEIRLDAAKHPRQRKHRSHKTKRISKGKMTDSTFQNLAAVKDMLFSELSSPSHDHYSDWLYRFKSAEIIRDNFVGPLAVSGLLLSAGIADGVDYVRTQFVRRAEENLRKEKSEKRKRYYGAEAKRRKEQAAEIAAARPPPENPCPTPEILIHAFKRRHDGEEEALRFGRLMIDLEEHQRAVLLNEGGVISGTSGGLRKWFKQNCPELLPHYWTCQRFKRRTQNDPISPEEL